MAEFPEALFEGGRLLHQATNTFFDVAYDGNGLWVFYNKNTSGDSLTVSRLNLHSLEEEMTWQIGLAERTFGSLMVACGHLYLVKNVTVIGSFIEHTYDLYTRAWSDNYMEFKVPFQSLSMLQYDHLDTKVYAWDGGNLLEYVMLFL